MIRSAKLDRVLAAADDPRRNGDRRPLPLPGVDGMPCFYTLPDDVLRLLHYTDQHCAGEVKMPEVVTGDEQAKRYYLVNSLMEEAIRSVSSRGRRPPVRPPRSCCAAVASRSTAPSG